MVSRRTFARIVARLRFDRPMFEREYLWVSARTPSRCRAIDHLWRAMDLLDRWSTGRLSGAAHREVTARITEAGPLVELLLTGRTRFGTARCRKW